MSEIFMKCTCYLKLPFPGKWIPGKNLVCKKLLSQCSRFQIVCSTLVNATLNDTFMFKFNCIIKLVIYISMIDNMSPVPSQICFVLLSWWKASSQPLTLSLDLSLLSKPFLSWTAVMWYIHVSDGLIISVQ